MNDPKVQVSSWCNSDRAILELVSQRRVSRLESYRHNPDDVREHTNNERSTFEGGYGDRQFHELLQNAVDAGAQPKQRVEAVLTDAGVYVANTGAPFSLEGVTSLLQSHISEKRDSRIGRFGRGFKAVVGISDGPRVFSRSVCVVFDREQSWEAIQRATGKTFGREDVPLLRLGWPADPVAAAEEDDVLAELLGWATTVVHLPFRDPAEGAQRIAKQLEEFEPEFLLLLSDRSITVTLDDRIHERRRAVTIKLREDKVVEVFSGDDANLWRRFEIAHPNSRLSDEALKDGGKTHCRDEYLIQWCAPLSKARGDAKTWTDKHFWLYFPTSHGSNIPGIVNGPWKTSDDRQSLLEGAFNESLVDAASQLVANTLARWDSADDLGEFLDYTPDMPESLAASGASWAGRHLAKRFWDSHRFGIKLPNGCGDRTSPSTMKLFPTDEFVVVEAWMGLVSDEVRATFPHLDCVRNQDRRRRTKRFLWNRIDLAEWLTAPEIAEPKAALSFMRGVAKPLSATSEGAALLRAPLIRGSDGAWYTAKDGVVRNIPRDLTHVVGIHALHPDWEANEALSSLLTEVLGLREFGDVDYIAALTAEIAEQASKGCPEAAWRRIAGLDRKLHLKPVVANLAKSPSLRLLRTQAGTWASPGEAIIATSSDSATPPSPVIGDFEFCERYQVVLELLGYRTQPWIDPAPLPPGTWGALDVEYSHFLKSWRSKATSGYGYTYLSDTKISHYSGSSTWMPRGVRVSGYAAVRPPRAYEHGSIRQKATWTASLLRSSAWRRPIQVDHDTTSYYALPTKHGRNGFHVELFEHGVVQIGDLFCNLRDVPAALPESWGEVRPPLPYEPEAIYLLHQGGFWEYAENCNGSWSGPLSCFPHEERTDWTERDLARFDCEFWTMLEERARNHGTDAERFAFYDDMLRHGFVPDDVIFDGRRHPLGTIWVVRTPEDEQQAERCGVPAVPLSNDEQVARWVEAGAKLLSGHLELFSELSPDHPPERLAAWGPAVLEAAQSVKDQELAEQVAATAVMRCHSLAWKLGDQVLNQAAVYDHGQNALYLRLDDTPHANQLQVAAKEIAWSAAQDALAFLDRFRAILRDRRLRDAATDAERIAILFDGAVELLGAAAAAGLRGESEAAVAGLTPTEQARLLLRVHGVETLKVLSKGVLQELDLHVEIPTRWGNNGPTRTFVDALGFSEDYLCTSVGRAPTVEVLCPLPLPPLHDYQQRVHEALLATIGGDSKRRLLTLPTGAGKTRVAIETIVVAMREAQHRGRLRVVIWIAHTDELCEQAVSSWERVWAVEGLPGERLTILRLWGGMSAKTPESGRVVVVTTNTTITSSGRQWLARADLLAIDEAHRSDASTYRDAIRSLRKDTPVLGLTATPFRGISTEGNEALARLFERNLVGQEHSAEALIRDEYLSHVAWETLEFPVAWELDEAEARYIEQFEELSAAFLAMVGESAERNRLIVEATLRRGPGDKIMVFACNVAHAHELSSLINLAAIQRRLPFEAAAVSHLTSTHLRRSIVERFSRTDDELNVLVNVLTMTMGFDAPLTNVLVIARPTFSPVLYQQIVGRGLRGPRNGGTERCTIINTLDNMGRFGPRLAFRELQTEWHTIDPGA